MNGLELAQYPGVNWLTTLTEKLSNALGSMTSLGLLDRSIHFELLKQTLIANSICFATWACWSEGPLHREHSEELAIKGASARFMRRGQRFMEDSDVIEEPFPTSLLLLLQPENESRQQKPKVTVRAESFGDGMKLLAGVSTPIVTQDGTSAMVGIDIALDELAEEAVTRPNRPTLELITLVEQTLGGALLVISSSNRLLGATAMALENTKRLTGTVPQRGEPVPKVLRDALDGSSPEGLLQTGVRKIDVAGQTLSLWMTPMSSRGRKLLFIEPATILQASPVDAQAELSRREQEVLACLSEGRSNDEIAAILSISHHTVRNHLDRVFKKLGVNNRYAAALTHIKNPMRQSTGATESREQRRIDHV